VTPLSMMEFGIEHRRIDFGSVISIQRTGSLKFP